MTYQPTPDQPPVVPGPQWYPPAPQPPAPRKTRPLVWIGLALAGLVGLGLVGGILAAAQDLGKTTAVATTAPLPQDKCGGGICDEDTPAEPAVTTTTAGPKPYPNQFKLTPKTVSKQCFGSAGCIVEVQVKAEYSGETLSEDDTWQVTYTLTGDESGPIIESFDLTGTTYDVSTISLSTKSSKTKISVKVTDVEKVGL